jgi:hypothetical protein
MLVLRCNQVVEPRHHTEIAKFWEMTGPAIYSGDLDGNDATAADPAWQPLIETPMHPEYRARIAPSRRRSPPSCRPSSVASRRVGSPRRSSADDR